jgi:hypothetical protein
MFARKAEGASTLEEIIPVCARNFVRSVDRAADAWKRIVDVLSSTLKN